MGHHLWMWAIGAILATAIAGPAWAGIVSNPVPIPEPASIALLAAGIGGVAWLKFRRRR